MNSVRQQRAFIACVNSTFTPMGDGRHLMSLSFLHMLLRGYITIQVPCSLRVTSRREGRQTTGPFLEYTLFDSPLVGNATGQNLRAQDGVGGTHHAEKFGRSSRRTRASSKGQRSDSAVVLSLSSWVSLILISL